MRRLWMALLAAVLLCAVLIVPAVAAEHSCASGHCCDCTDNHAGWTAISKAQFGTFGDFSTLSSGKYYIDDAACTDGVFVKDILLNDTAADVTICLNGKTWTGSLKRPLSVNNGTLKVVDCSAQTNGVSKGKIKGVDVTTSIGANESGGAIRVLNASVLSVYNCTVEGGTAKYGGAVYADAKTTVVFNGGVILGGTAVEYGGAVCAKGAFTLLNAKIEGGSAPRGGAVFVMEGEAGDSDFIIESSTVQNGVAVRDNSITSGANESGRGSNIFVHSGKLTVRKASVIQGGSVRFTEALPAGTTYDTNSNTDSPSNRYGGSAIYAASGTINIAASNLRGYVDGGKLWREGGTIYNAGATINLIGTTVTASYVNTRGGVIYNASGTVIARGGSTLDASNLESVAYGGAVANRGTFELRDATIKGCTAIYVNGGGAVHQAAGTFKMTNASALITGGTVFRTSGDNAYGGNVSVDGGTFQMTNGTISGGIASGTNTLGGGNVAVMKGTFTMTGGTITGGQTVGSVAQGGGVYVAAAATATIGGSANVSGNLNGDVYLAEGAVFSASGLTGEASIGVKSESAAKGLVIANNVPSTYSDEIFYQDSLYLLSHNTTTGELSLGDSPAATLNGDSLKVYTSLQAAINAAQTGDFVRLSSDYSGAALTVSGDLFLDLNGFDINSNVSVSGGALFLLDSATADYSVKDGSELTGYGTITGTITGPVKRAFTTSRIKANYDNHNYRYMVVCVDGTYSSHRIYMTVKSTILYPQTPALNYRTVLRCDEYLANVINTSGGYGILVQSYKYDAAAANNQGAVSYAYGDYVEAGATVLAYSEANGVVLQENNRVTRLTNILDSASKNSAENQYRAAADVVAKAYLWVEDDMNTATMTAENINAKGVLSSGVTYSMKNMILLADSKWADLSQAQKIALGGMYNKWSALMGSWGMKNIPTMSDAAVRFGCLCGDPDSTDNPCAEKGHVEFVWLPTATMPTKSGNYYLTAPLNLTTQVNIPEGVHINLNTHGNAITTTGDRVAIVYGVFNLTNYNFDGSTPATSLVTGSGRGTDGGGTLMVKPEGNVSLYDNITVQAAETHTIGNGVVSVSGSLNIYGATVKGTDVTAQNAYGGAICINDKGRMYINSGSVEGGTAIYGGNIYIASGGSATLAGGTVKNGEAGDYDADTLAGWGGNIYVKSGGTLKISAGATISGGSAADNGGSIHVDNGATFTMSGGTISGGKTRDQGGNLFLNTGATISGGTISGGQAANGGNLALGNSENAYAVTLKGVTISGGQATAAGGNIRVQNANGTVTSLTIQAGTSITGGQAATNGGNLSIRCPLTINGGSIGTGTVSTTGTGNTYGGNIYIDAAVATISNCTITGGTADSTGGKGYGGSICVTGAGSSLTLSGSTKVQNGYCKTQGGNIFVNNTGSGLTVQTGVQITGGHAITGGGNIFASANAVTISGGSISGGKTTANGDTTTNTANVYVLDGTLNLSGGNISGSTTVFANGGNAAFNLSGTPVVTGNGIFLNYGGSNKVNVSLDLASLNNDTASVVLRCTKFEGNHPDGICLASATSNWTGHPYEKVARKVLVDCATDKNSEISYETTGIYLRKSTAKGSKWTCTCGANYGEAHVNGCDRFDEEWKEWKLSSKNMALPNQAGYWYITNATTTTNAANVTYVEGVKTGTMSYDYYNNGTGYQRLYTVRAKNTAGAYMTNNDGRYVSVAEYLTINNGAPSYAATVGSLSTVAGDTAYVAYDGSAWTAYTAADFDKALLSGYEIHVDLNGMKLETAEDARAFSFRGAATPTINQVKYNTCRNTDVTLNLIDSSQGHVGALATYGVYTGVTAAGVQTKFSSNGTQYQGKLIWMDCSYNSGDKLTTSYVTLNASSTMAGTGLVLFNDGGTANFYNSTIIGGTAQGFYKSEVLYNKDMNNDGTISDNICSTYMKMGGGAITITGNGSVTLSGGSITGGKAIYRYMRAEDGVYYDQAVGGGNVFVNDGTFTVDGGSVTGGMALVYAGGDTVDYATYGNTTGKNKTAEYSYASGGGVFVAKGKVIVKNGAKITDNYTGKISGQLFAPSETGANLYNCIDPSGTVSNKVKDNVFLGGNPLEVVNLTGTVGFNNGGYVGTFATYTGTAPSTSKLVCDESAGASFLVNTSKGRLYYPAKDSSGNNLTGSSVYLVGYGKASVQPSTTALKAGLIMTNYGNERNTYELYNSKGSLYSQYYDIVTDSKGYFDGWDTQCYATALATTDGEGDTVIIIALDGQTHTDAVGVVIKRMVSAATGVPQNNISISSGHQHSIPGPAITYGNVAANGDTAVTGNYAYLYYTGIVNAAVAAMEDRAQATVKVGKLETTASGIQYNFVRNYVVKSGSTKLGMYTNSHMDVYQNDSGKWVQAGTLKTYDTVTLDYESDIDSIMQLVQYTRSGKDTIVMANFQTHPHLGSGPNSYYAHSDVIGAFRYNLESLSGYKVLYFSGASGNVNPSTSKEEDAYDQAWAGPDLETVTDNRDEALIRLERASVWGQKLAAMANNFLGGANYTGSVKMTAVSGSNDVEVKVEDYTCTLKTTDATDTAIKNSTQIRYWSTGEYVDSFASFDYTAWKKYVGNYTNAADRIYSAFDVINIRRSALWEEAGYTKADMTITAYAMGEIGFVAAPYEMFQENGAQIKNGATDYKMTIVATLANGSNNYIPSAAGFANGGYSTDNCKFAAGTGEQLANKFVEMLNGLK